MYVDEYGYETEEIVHFDTDVDIWPLNWVESAAFHGAVVSDLYAQAAVWLRELETEYDFIVVIGSNLQINQDDDTYDLTIAVEAT